ncbi:unnamed protein product, partial [Ixodes hexagonus]
GLVAANGKKVIIVKKVDRPAPALYHRPPPPPHYVRPVYTHPAHHHVKSAPVHHQQYGKDKKGGGSELGRGDPKTYGYDDNQLVKEKVVVKEEQKVHKENVQVVVKEPPPLKVKEHVQVRRHNNLNCGNKWWKKLQKSLRKSYKKARKGLKVKHHKRPPVVLLYTQTPFYYFTQPPRLYYNTYDNYDNGYNRY